MVLERNLLPGGCVSTYYRKGFLFEAGATTLVGLDEGMPLKFLLDELALDLPARHLQVPMQVHLNNGKVLTRYQDLDQWITEAERVFGPQGQRGFWQECYRIAQFVWDTSIKQRSFPPSSWRDLPGMAKAFRPKQLGFIPYAFQSTESLLKKHGLNQDPVFLDFVNEQLWITAQNEAPEVNALFGGTALCYTNFGNYYLDGGLITLSNTLVDYIKSKGGEVIVRASVDQVISVNGHYEVHYTERKATKVLKTKNVVSGVPLNNTIELYQGKHLAKAKKVLPATKLVSAFSTGIGFKTTQQFECIHHQIHLPEGLPGLESGSIFLSLNHPGDNTRTPEGDFAVGSITTHIYNPDPEAEYPIPEIEAYIVKTLEEKGFLKKEDIVYLHSSTPRSWENWTGRKFGAVGGYPQYLKIKPWQLADARLDHKGAYICGDTTYPGQGIPGTCLSGLIAYEKMRIDGRI
ncbi:MAG: NAD(P)/FAD-dependent oxidoreductase [Bacteroidota bacterium]